MLIEIYMAESALLRAEKLANDQGEDAAAGQIRMAKLYTYNAIEKVGQAGREGILSFAEGDDRQLLMMGLKRFTKPLPYNVVQLRREIADQVIEANKYPF
jgi:hypothetical protein